jgi:hypothetical protein
MDKTKLDEFDIFVEIEYRNLLKKSLSSNVFLSEIRKLNHIG